MGGKVWSEKEEQTFWEVVVPQSPHAPNPDNRILSWAECVVLMQETMGELARREYTQTMLYEHHYQNTKTGHRSPRAIKFVDKHLQEIAYFENLLASPASGSADTSGSDSNPSTVSPSPGSSPSVSENHPVNYRPTRLPQQSGRGTDSIPSLTSETFDSGYYGDNSSRPQESRANKVTNPALGRSLPRDGGNGFAPSPSQKGQHYIASGVSSIGQSPVSHRSTKPHIRIRHRRADNGGRDRIDATERDVRADTPAPEETLYVVDPRDEITDSAATEACRSLLRVANSSGRTSLARPYLNPSAADEDAGRDAGRDAGLQEERGEPRRELGERREWVPILKAQKAHRTPLPTGRIERKRSASGHKNDYEPEHKRQKMSFTTTCERGSRGQPPNMRNGA